MTTIHASNAGAGTARRGSRLPIVDAPWALPVLVVLIAAHSAAVGACLLFFTGWSVAFGGWGAASPAFFPRQAGIFHFVVVAGYLIEYFKYRGVTLLLTAKATAVAFLVAATMADGGPWALPASAAADAAMGLAAWWVSRRAAAAGGRAGAA